MAKMNPLFVDSTRLQGDVIGTHVELSNIILFDDENLYLVLIQEDGQEVYYSMQAEESNTSDLPTVYQAHLQLKHQSEMKAYFGIEKNGELLLRSNCEDKTAVYLWTETWTPIEEFYPLRNKPADEPVEINTTQEMTFQEILSDAEQNSLCDFKRVEVPPPAISRSNEVVPSNLPEQVVQISTLLNKWGFT